MAWPGKYAYFMTFSINWTAASCIIALLIGLWNIFYSWRYEKKRREKEITDEALDMALNLWALSIQYSTVKDDEKIKELGGHMSSLMLALKIYGYPVNQELIIHHFQSTEEVGKELERLVNTICLDKKRMKY